MSTRRSMTVRSMLIVYVAAGLSVAACGRKSETPAAPPAAAPSASKTGTVAAPPANLSGAKVREIINTQGIEAATQARIGNARAADGSVTKEVTTFKPSDHIYLTMWIPEAPRGLQTSADWLDADGKLIRQDRFDPAGAKMVTFEWTGKPLKPGKYHVTGYWGGNVAAERDFTVESAPAKAATTKKKH